MPDRSGTYVQELLLDLMQVLQGRFRSHRTFRWRHDSHAKAGRLRIFSRGIVETESAMA